MARTRVRISAGRRKLEPIFPVEVRSLNEPKPGWTIGKALDLLDQGYRVSHVAQVTGFIAPYLEAQRKMRDQAMAE
jgi:hypothetical protein